MEGNWASQIGPNNKYQYNNKELNDNFGLNWNDYGARWYDAAIGRWTSVDPLAEMQLSFSPYTYTYNNPIAFIDPTGMIGQLPDAAQHQKDQSQAEQNEGRRSAGESSSASSSEDEDCCPWLDRKFDQQRVHEQAIAAGQDPNEAWEAYLDGINDTAMGEAAAKAVVIVGTWYLGGVAVKAVLRGGSVLLFAAKGGELVGKIPTIVSFGQKGLRDPAAVGRIKKAMLEGTYEYTAKKGIIAGWINNGKYILGEGHHRIAAAMEILKETKNATPLLNLIKNGAWSTAKFGGSTRPLPSRSMWGKFRNWLGF